MLQCLGGKRKQFIQIYYLKTNILEALYNIKKAKEKVTNIF
jgi:hypothetical protein